MQTIETVVTVTEEGHLTGVVPPEVAPGTHRVTLIIEEQPTTTQPAQPTTRVSAPGEFPVFDLGSWPEDLSLRREDMYEDSGL